MRRATRKSRLNRPAPKTTRTSASAASARFNSYPGVSDSELIPLVHVTVIIAMTMSPTSASPASRAPSPSIKAIAPPNSMTPPSTAKNPPGCRCAVFEKKSAVACNPGPLNAPKSFPAP